MHSSSNGQRLRFTLAVMVFVILHLTVELLSGGVVVHYPLMDENMPPLSNWWGLLVLPGLAWIAYGFMQKDSSGHGIMGLRNEVFFRLGGAFVYGAALSAGFELGLGETPLYLLLGLFLGGIFYPVYRAELVLGLIMGMTYTFGAIIPTVVIGLVAISSLVLHNAALFIIRKLRPQAQ